MHSQIIGKLGHCNCNHRILGKVDVRVTRLLASLPGDGGPDTGMLDCVIIAFCESALLEQVEERFARRDNFL